MMSYITEFMLALSEYTVLNFPVNINFQNSQYAWYLELCKELKGLIFFFKALFLAGAVAQ